MLLLELNLSWVVVVIVNEEAAVVFLRIAVLGSEQAPSGPTFLDVVPVLLWIANSGSRHVHLFSVNLHRNVIVVEPLRTTGPILGLAHYSHCRYLMTRAYACGHEFRSAYRLVARYASEDHIASGDCGANILDAVRSAVNWWLVSWMAQVCHGFRACFGQSLWWRLLRFVYKVRPSEGLGESPRLI